MTKSPHETWVSPKHALLQLCRERDRGELPHDLYPLLIEAMAEGLIRSTAADFPLFGAPQKPGKELHPEFWRDAGAKWLRQPASSDGIPLEQFELRVHKGDLEEWLRPSGAKSGGRRGREPEYDWDAFWIEVAAIVARGTLPATQAALVDHLEGWFEDQVGKSPTRRLMEGRISRLYQRFGSTN